MCHKWLLCGKKLKKIAPAATKIYPCGEGSSHIFLWGEEKNSTFSKNILPWSIYLSTNGMVDPWWNGMVAGSGSGQMIRIRPDPDLDPQHWKKVLIKSGCKVVPQCSRCSFIMLLRKANASKAWANAIKMPDQHKYD